MAALDNFLLKNYGLGGFVTDPSQYKEYATGFLGVGHGNGTFTTSSGGSMIMQNISVGGLSFRPTRILFRATNPNNNNRAIYSIYNKASRNAESSADGNSYNFAYTIVEGSTDGVTSGAIVRMYELIGSPNKFGSIVDSGFVLPTHVAFVNGTWEAFGV